jgi:hypothetical protein
MTHQPAISFSISLQLLFNRAGGRTSNVRQDTYDMKKLFVGCGLAFLMAVAVIAGLGYLGYMKVRDWNISRNAKNKAEQALVEAGIAHRRKYFESHLSHATRATIPADFYTYDGFRDWWRLPLVFPYQLVCIDTLDSASLEKYDTKFSVADPNVSSSEVFGDLTRLATDNRILLFETKIGSTITYGMMRYESGIRSDFTSEVQLWNAATKEGYSGSHVLQNIDKVFSIYYDWSKTFVEQVGTGQPATRPESKPEGSDKPQPEAEGRSR